MDLISSFGSKLSTIKQPSYQIGQDAVTNIYKVINKETVPSTHKLEQTIIFRDTTKAIISK